MMKKHIIIFLTIGLALVVNYSGFGQEIAVTERGDSVVLYYNGSWDYYENYLSHQDDIAEIRMNHSHFVKPKTSNQKINGSGKAYEVWYNDKKWKRIPPGNINADADMAVQMVKGDAYGMLIYEELEMPVETLSQIAIDNAVNALPDIKMVDREYRVVNNDTLIWMQMDGTASGIKISYYSYYFSNENGSIQFHTFTGQNLLSKYKNDMEDLLNGLIVTKLD